MSKQHKMEFKGKKYVTKFSKEFCTCKGCIFFRGVNLCKYAETKKDVKCHANENKDGRDRIWVEDKSEDKSKNLKDHIWVIEYYDDFKKEWYFYDARNTRKEARYSLLHKSTDKISRIRKFIPVK